MGIYFDLLILLTHLVLPGLFLFWLFASGRTSLLQWFSAAFLSGSYIAFLFYAGAGWNWVGVFWPYLFILAFATIIILQIKRGLPKQKWPKRWSQGFFTSAVNFLVGGFFALLMSSWPMAYQYHGTALDLTFPLTGGTFSVAHGGGNSQVNYHVAVKAQTFALDIVKLNGFGVRAVGLLPDDLEDYEIFGNQVLAPCAGEVIEAVDGLPDQTPMTMDRENIAGNHVSIFCHGVTVLLAHLKQGSVLVKAGDLVTDGQPIGRAGNTGNTSEPHLHIHAVKGRVTDMETLAGTGEPVAITFKGRFLVRNSLFRN